MYGWMVSFFTDDQLYRLYGDQRTCLREVQVLRVCVCVGAQVQILKFTECLRLGRNVLTHEYNIALNFVQYSAHQFLLVHNDYMTTCKVFTVTSC